MPKISIDFISEKLRDEVRNLKKGDDSERKLYELINKAFHDIENNFFSCIKIPQKLWPKSYRKYGASNLWKYDLPNGWRLVFFIEADEIKVVAIILEWLSHKEYEKRFNY